MHYSPIVNPSTSSTRYEQLRHRIHRQINSAAAQEWRRTVITREQGERVDDWEQLLEHFEVEESVLMTHLDGGCVQLTWTNQHCF